MEEGEKSWNENLRTFKHVFLNICILLLFQNGEKPSSLYIFQLFAFIKKTKRKKKKKKEVEMYPLKLSLIWLDI